MENARKLRVAFLTPQLPYPPVSGGAIKSYKMLEYICRKYEVHLFSLLKGDDLDHVNELVSKIDLTSLTTTYISLPRSIGNYVNSLMTCVPLSIYRNRSSKMRLLIEENISIYDVIVVDHFLMFQYVPRDYKGRIVLHTHNAEYVMWRRYAELETNLLKKIVLALESKRISMYERNIGKKADAILAAPNDIHALCKLGIPRDYFIETLHLGDQGLLELHDVEFNSTEERLLYVGSLDWEANKDGLLWFLLNVWPLLIKNVRNIQFDIIGRNPGPEIVDTVKGLSGVTLRGFVDNLELYYSRARVFVAPLRFGSGIKVKVVNALYRGIPTCTTSVGAEGIEAISGRELMISDDCDAMAGQIQSLLRCRKTWSDMRDKARALAREKYTWTSTLKRVEEAIDD